MKFEAYNVKDTIKKIKFLVAFVAVVALLIGGAYLIIEIPNTIRDNYDPLFLGYSKMIEREDLPRFAFAFVVTLGLVVVSIILFRILHRCEKDAKKYGLKIENKTFYILCDGKYVNLDINDIKSIVIKEKNADENRLKAVWADVCLIVTETEIYKLYYLKYLDEAKALYEAEKARVS